MTENEVTSQPMPTVPQDPPVRSPKNKGIIVLSVVVLLLIIASVAVLLSKSIMKSSTVKLAQTLTQESPTPMPFAEMTVPYLRERKYPGKLGERNQIGDNGTYTSYLTNYDSDGLKVNALLTIPDGEKPQAGWSAIVFIHGYIPPTLYATTEKYVEYVDFLARNGFVVLKIDLRGHGQSEGEAGGGYYGSDYVIDALNAYNSLQTADFVNPKAVGMWGHSMAGNILLRSAVVKKDIPAVVIWAGAVYSYEDQRKYGIQDTSYRPPTNVTRTQQRRRELFEKQGSPSASSPFWQQVAATNYLNDFKGAIEIHHAVDDDVVNIGYSRDLITLLDKTSVPHELYEYPTGGHNIAGSSFGSAMQRTVDFYKKYLAE